VLTDVKTACIKIAIDSAASATTQVRAPITSGHRSAEKVSNFTIWLRENCLTFCFLMCKELLSAAKKPTVKDHGISWVDIDVGEDTKELNGSLIDYLNLTAACSQNVNQIQINVLAIAGTSLFSALKCGNSSLKIGWPLKEKQNIFRLDGLNSGTEYQVRLYIQEKNVKVYNTEGQFATFNTSRSCSPNCECSYFTLIFNNSHDFINKSTYKKVNQCFEFLLSKLSLL
jgi:hypothetical protein